jgi:ATP-dependent DNA ligase
MGMRWNPIVQALVWAALASPALPLPAAESLPLLLAETEQGQADVALYLVSEKLDGVRAFWDGQTLRTRKGHPIQRSVLVCRSDSRRSRSTASCGWARRVRAALWHRPSANAG